MEGQSHSESEEGIFDRNVTVLLATDVTKRNDQLFMPNTIEMAQIKKKEKGQYVSEIKFSNNMSEEEVKGRILSHFPNLENQRFFFASVVENRTRLEFHGEPRVWDGQFMKRTLGGNSALYIFTEMTNSEWSETLSQRPTVHTQSRNYAGKKSGKRRNDGSASAAVCKRKKECSATGVSPIGSLSTPMLLYCVNVSQNGPQGHPSTTTTSQKNISSQNFYLDRFSKATDSQKYAIPVAYTCTRTSSSIVPGHQTQASGGILPSAHPPVSTSSSPNLLNFSMQTSVQKHQSQPIVSRAPQRQLCHLVRDDSTVRKDTLIPLQLGNSIPVTNFQKQIQTGLDQHVLQNTNSLLPGTAQGAGSSMITLDSGNICQRSVPAHPTVGSQWGLQASVPSQSQIGQGQSPSTCLVYNKGDNPISQETQTSGTSLTESGILHNYFSKQTDATADPSPISHESDSGLSSTRNNDVGVAIASNSADQSEDTSTLPELFSSSEDSDSTLEEGREIWFGNQTCGVVKKIYPSSGPIEKYIPFCIVLGERLPRKYRKLKLVAKFEGIDAVPLDIENDLNLTGKIKSSEAGEVKVTVKCEGSNGNSIGFTFFEFIEDKYQGLLKEVLKAVQGQPNISNACASPPETNESSGSDIQEATPCGAGGTGVSNVNKRSCALPEKILTLLVYKAAEINGREFLEMVFNTSAGRVILNYYRKSSTLPRDVARANGHTILGDFLEDVNERLSKEVCSEDSYETVNWLELEHAVEKKVCLPCTDDAQLVSSPDGDDNQSDYEADDEASLLPSPADANANGGELDDSEHGDIGQITSDENDSCDSIATDAERQRNQTETERQAWSGSLFTNRFDSVMEMESSSHSTDNVEIRSNPRVSCTNYSEKYVLNSAQDAVTNVALYPNQEGVDRAEGHFVTSAVMAVAGETSNAIELSSEGGTDSSAERQNQEPTDSMTRVLPCKINSGTLMDPYIQKTTKNTFSKWYCDKPDQKEEEDDLEKPLDCNQEGAGPPNDHIVTSAVTSIARETPNSSEVGKNSSASRHIQGPVSGITKVPPYGDNEKREAGPFIIMKMGNTLRERNCNGKDQEEELNNVDKPPDSLEDIGKSFEKVREELSGLNRLNEKCSSLMALTEKITQEVPPEIRARGIVALEAYNNALAEGQACVKRVPVMIIGQERSGKTSVKKSLKGICFNPNEVSTLGIEVDRYDFKVTTEIWKIGEKDKETNIDNTATSFEYIVARWIAHKLTTYEKISEVKSTSLAESTSKDFEVFDIPEESEPNETTSYADLLEPTRNPASTNTTDDEPHLPTREVRNPTELKPDEDLLTTALGKLPNFDDVTKLLPQFLRENWKDDEEDIYSTLWDFAGQSVYYTTHPLFLTSRAVYCLVYDLGRNPSDKATPSVKQGVYKAFNADEYNLKTNFDYLDFWMSSMASLKDPETVLPFKELPAVFLVCTHADKPYCARNPFELAFEIFGNLRAKPYGAHLLDVFCVDNTKSGTKSECEEIIRLREAINRISKELPHVTEAIPIKWLRYEKALCALKESDYKFISLVRAKEIASKVCNMNDNEIQAALNFLHGLRVLIHFDDTPELSELVFLDSQWLIDVFKSVITVRAFHEEKNFVHLWKRLEMEGILEEKLLKHVWSSLIPQKETYESLIAIMEKFNFLCPWPSSQDFPDKRYLVPSMLRTHPPEEISTLVESAKIPSFFIKFDTGRVPPGLFSRFVVEFLLWWSRECPCLALPQLYSNFARFNNFPIQGLSAVFLCHSSTIEVVVISVNTGVDMANMASIRPFHSQLTLIINQVWGKFWVKNVGCEVCFLCPVCSRGRVINSCTPYYKEGCEQDECLHFISELDLGDETQVSCTRSVAVVDNQIQVEKFSPWISCAEKKEMKSFQSDERLQAIVQGGNEKTLVIPRKAVASAQLKPQVSAESEGKLVPLAQRNCQIQTSAGNQLKAAHSRRDAFQESDGTLVPFSQGNGYKDLVLPKKVSESLQLTSDPPKEVVDKLLHNLQLDDASLKDPKPETEKWIRCLTRDAKDHGRTDVVKYLREFMPAGTAGPMLLDTPKIFQKLG